MRIFFTLLLLLAGLLAAQAQQVSISGSAPDFAGRLLQFYTVNNYFCNDEIVLGECTVADSGDFAVSFSCRNTQLIHTRLGVFRLRFFVEPGFSYEVELPPRIDKSPEEEESPFFEESTLYMNILSVKDRDGQEIALESELNSQLAVFDQTFNPLYDRLALDASMKRPAAGLDSAIGAFLEKLPHTGNGYFDNYAFYRSGLLYYAAQRNGVRYISDTYFAGKPLLYENEAYMELFDTTYDRYFMYFGRNSADIYDVINSQASFSGLKRLLEQDGVLPTDSLCELVILKNIYGEFYSDRFLRRSLLHLLDSAIVQTKIERHRELASEIRSKVTKLLRGFKPPEFSLYNQDSTLVSLQDYAGKYVYLMFCTTQNYICLGQYEHLAKLYHTHHKWLDIVIVSVDDSFSSMQNFSQKSGYMWDFLHFANDPDVLEKYDVRIFPTCFLIDPEGKLVLSPAPPPVTVFEPEPSEVNNLERTLWIELNRNGLWQEYIRRGLINN